MSASNDKGGTVPRVLVIAGSDSSGGALVTLVVSSFQYQFIHDQVLSTLYILIAHCFSDFEHTI